MGKGIEVGSSIGHYRIVSRFGAGGMGEVYLAHEFGEPRGFSRSKAILIHRPSETDEFSGIEL